MSSSVIKDKDIKFVDLRFTDPRGKWQHVTMVDQASIDEELFADGTDVRRLVDRRLEGDQRVRHDPDAGPETRPHIDPFFAQSTLIDHSATSSSPIDRRALQPRPALDRQEGRGLPQVLGHRRHRYVGPEAEFFVFDDVRYNDEPYNTGFKLDSTELPTNTTPTTRAATSATVRRVKGGYFPVPPVDSAAGHAREMLAVMPRNGRRGKAPPRSGARPSTNSASSSARW
jgi:glutamine synthetase